MLGSEGEAAIAEVEQHVVLRSKQPIDIEILLQWAIERSGRLPWLGVSDKDLAFDHGWTARPRSVPQYQASSLTLRCSPSDDAAAVIAAINTLEPKAALSVTACAKNKMRPNWLPGVVPERVVTQGYRRKRGKKKHRLTTMIVWHPCDPLTLESAHNAYSRWHDAVASIADLLKGQLDNFEIRTFLAPEAPWNKAFAENACNGENTLNNSGRA